MEPKIIFDTATKPFAWEPIWACGGAFLFGGVIIFLKKINFRRALSAKWGYFMILCAVPAAGYDVARWYLSLRDHAKALASHRYEVIEGVVENLHPMPDDGSSNESFTISGHTFSYNDYVELNPTTCFNQTMPHKGPIRNGLLLRIRFTDQCILQIETLSQNVDEGHK